MPQKSLQLGDDLFGRHAAGQQFFQHSLGFGLLCVLGSFGLGSSLFGLCLGQLLGGGLYSSLGGFQLCLQLIDVGSQCCNSGFCLLFGSSFFSNECCIIDLIFCGACSAGSMDFILLPLGLGMGGSSVS